MDSIIDAGISRSRAIRVVRTPSMISTRLSSVKRLSTLQSGLGDPLRLQVGARYVFDFN